MRADLVALVVGGVTCAACTRDRAAGSPPPSPTTAPEVARAPVRGAAGDADVRVMLAEVASAKACAMIRGQFRGLTAPDRPATYTGTLWIRTCEITNDGTRVTFAITGSGWQWADQTKQKAGGTFVVREYVKFDVAATLSGTLDLAYDRASHVASLWFTPSASPELHFTPVDAVAVDERGLWSSVVGGMASVFGDSPAARGTREAKQQGAAQLAAQLADGLTVAIDLCTGYQRFTLGRPPKGQLGAPNPGESKTVPVELHPGGLAIIGPQPAPDGITILIDAKGPARVGLACAAAAETAAGALVSHRGHWPGVATLAQADVATNGRARLHVGPQRCPVVVVAEPAGAQPVVLDWVRPPREAARATGGPAIRCARTSP